MCKKNFIPISIGFCAIPLQNYREIFKKYRKRAITLQKKQFLKNKRKTFFDIHIKNVVPKFESCRLNGVDMLSKDCLVLVFICEIDWSSDVVHNLSNLSTFLTHLAHIWPFCEACSKILKWEQGFQIWHPKNRSDWPQMGQNIGLLGSDLVLFGKKNKSGTF